MNIRIKKLRRIKAYELADKCGQAKEFQLDFRLFNNFDDKIEFFTK